MKIIITESQYLKLIKEYDYPGTKKPLGADGIDDVLFNEILRVIPILFSADTTSLPLVNKVKSQGKLKREDKTAMAQFMNQILNHCNKVRKSDDIEHNGNNFPTFCMDIHEIFHSDSDNIFSYSYGITR
jgi:hypothetical protein